MIYVLIKMKMIVIDLTVFCHLSNYQFVKEYHEFVQLIVYQLFS